MFNVEKRRKIKKERQAYLESAIMAMSGNCSEYDVYKTSGEKSVEKILKKESGPTYLARFFEE